MLAAIFAIVASATSQCGFTTNGSETESGSISVQVFWTLEPIGCTLTPVPSDWAAHFAGRSDAERVHSEETCYSDYEYASTDWWDAQATPPVTTIQGSSASLSSLQGEASASAWYDGEAVCSVLGLPG